MALQRLKEEAEKSKIALSSTQKININLPFITANSSGPKHLNIELTRSKLDQLCDSLYQRTVLPFKACLKDAKLSAGDINNLVLVGGMTRVPKVIQTSRDLAGKEPNKSVNPDEVVAMGAAVQGGVLKGDVRDILLLDVTPLTLGIETAGGVSTPMIERNTTIPTKKSQVFSTYADNQTAVDIKVLQGERSMANDNKVLGNFRLDGIPAAQRGVPQIEVSFDIDANGIVNVSAKDMGTGKDQNITISGSSGISDKEVEKFKKEAELHAATDEKIKDAVESRNSLDSMIYQTEKQISELGKKISVDKKNIIESLLSDAKKVLDNKNASTKELKNANEKLTKEFQKIAQDIYSRVNNSSEKNSDVTDKQNSKSTTKKDNNVVDADFEVVDDKATEKK
jgi:molecular chaperone DnaK